jgi:hypothetical protein
LYILIRADEKTKGSGLIGSKRYPRYEPSLSVMYDSLSLTNSTLLTADMILLKAIRVYFLL